MLRLLVVNNEDFIYPGRQSVNAPYHCTLGHQAVACTHHSHYTQVPPEHYGMSNALFYVYAAVLAAVILMIAAGLRLQNSTFWIVLGSISFAAVVIISLDWLLATLNLSSMVRVGKDGPTTYKNWGMLLAAGYFVSGMLGWLFYFSQRDRKKQTSNTS